MIPLERAALCVDCSVIFELGDACPRCASSTWLSLGRVLNGRGNGVPAGFPAGQSGPTQPAAPEYPRAKETVMDTALCPVCRNPLGAYGCTSEVEVEPGGGIHAYGECRAPDPPTGGNAREDG